MNQCCTDFPQINCGTRRRDPLIECFEENLKLKAFYQLLRSAKPRPSKNRASKFPDNRCFCEKKRAQQAEQLRKRNELSNQRELLLLQCMCASMGPLRQKLKEVKNNKEDITNLKDRVLKQCLCSAIEIILKTRRKVALEKKRNALRAQLNKRHIQFQQSAEKKSRNSDAVDIEHCCRHYALVAARQYHRKMLRSQNEQPSSTTASESESDCDKERQETEPPKRESRNRSKKCTPTTSKRSQRQKQEEVCCTSAVDSTEGASSYEPNCLRNKQRAKSKRHTPHSSRQSISDTNLSECPSRYREICSRKPKQMSSLRPTNRYKTESSCEPNSSRQSQDRSVKRYPTTFKKVNLDVKNSSPKRRDSTSSYEPYRSRNQSKFGSSSKRSQSKKCSPTNSRDSSPDSKRTGCCRRNSKSDTSPKSSRHCSPESKKKAPKEKSERTGCCRRNSKSDTSPKSSRTCSPESKKKAPKEKSERTGCCKRNPKSDTSPNSSRTCSPESKKKASKEKSDRTGCCRRNSKSDTSPKSSRPSSHESKKKASKEKSDRTGCCRRNSKSDTSSRSSRSCSPESKKKTPKEKSERTGCCKRNSKSDMSPKSSRSCSPESKKAQKEKPERTGCCKRKSKSDTSPETKTCRENSNSSKKSSPTSSRQSSPDWKLQQCASKCLRKCCKEAFRRKSKQTGNRSCCSRRNSATSSDPNISSNKGDNKSCKNKAPQLRGGCDYQSSSSWDRSRSPTIRKKPKSSFSTDTMNSTRFRGRWFFRGKNTLVHQNFLPPRSSMKSPTHSKNSDDKKRLRFNPSSRHFIHSSNLSSVKNQQEINLNKQTDRSKSPPSSERAKASSADNRSLKLPRSHEWLKEVKRQLKLNRQKGGETTDTDQKCKKNNRFVSKMAEYCRCRKQRNQSSCLKTSSSNESICADEPEYMKTEDCQEVMKATMNRLLPGVSDCIDKEQQTEGSHLRSSAAIHQMKTEIPKDISSSSLMSDLSLTKVYKDLLVILRPDLQSDNNTEQQCKEMPKKRKMSVRKKSVNSPERNYQKTSSRPSKIRLYLLQPPAQNEPYRRARRRRNTRRSSSRRTNPFGGTGLPMPRAMNQNSQPEVRFSAMSDQLPRRSSASKRPKSISCQHSEGCAVGCGQRKVRVNYLDPERWASLKKNLKLPKNPKPLPENFILDTRVSNTDPETERCRKQKRQRQLDEWQKEIHRKKLESDPFYCPEMQKASADEKPGSEVYYVCRPVQTGENGNTNEGACVYECCYCPNPESLGNQWKEIDPKIVVNCDQNLSISANAQQPDCTPSRRSGCSTTANEPSKCRTSSSEGEDKSPQYRNNDRSSSNPKCRRRSESSECRGSSPLQKTEDLDSRNKSTFPKKGQKKLPNHSPPNIGRSPHGAKTKNLRSIPKRNADDHSSQKLKFQQSPSRSKGASRTSSSSCCSQLKSNEREGALYPSPCRITNEPSNKYAMNENRGTNFKIQNPTSNESICQDDNERRDIVGTCQCDCAACRESAKKIDVDRKRMQSFKQQSQYQNEHVSKQSTIGCSCSLCNNGCCLFNTIEKHFIICQQNKPSDFYRNEQRSETEESCQESGTEKTTASSSSSSSGKKLNQRHSWCCTDDFFLMCNKNGSDTENNYDTNVPNGSRNAKQNPQLNLVRDNCYKRPRCTNSADLIDPEFKRNCLYLWVPKCADDSSDKPAEAERNVVDENFCTKSGTFFQVVKVKSDELGFLTQDRRQAGGTSEKNILPNTKDIQPKSKRKRAGASKSVKKQVYCYKVKCQQEEEPNQKKFNENNTKELLVTACELQNKQKSTTPGPVKIKISQSMRPKEQNNLSNCSTSRNALKTNSAQRK